MTDDVEFEDPIEEVYAVRRKIVEAAREWMKQDESEGRVYVNFPSARIVTAMG